MLGGAITALIYMMAMWVGVECAKAMTKGWR